MFDSLRRLIENTTLKVPTPVELERDALQYNNFNTTLRILPENYVLPLENILAHNSGGFLKCTPRLFCAITIRLKTVLGICTHLIFRSGKMNVVGAKTLGYARYSAHYVRLYVASIVGPFLNGDKIYLSNLNGCTVFEGFRVRLIVVSANLKCLPRLDYLLDVAPDVAKWNPGLFPGMQFRVWISPRHECTCVKKRGKVGCKCNVRVILFDTGNIVITGSRTFADVNTTLELLRNLFSNEEFLMKDPLVDSSQRFEARKQLLLKKIEFTGFTKRKKQEIQPDNRQSLFSYVSKRGAATKYRTLTNPLSRQKANLTIEEILETAREKGLQQNVDFLCAILQ